MHFYPTHRVFTIIDSALCILSCSVLYLTYEKHWNIYVLHCLLPISALQENDHDKDNFIRAYISSYEYIEYV